VRLRSPFEEDGNVTAWMAVAPDGSEAVVGYYQTLNHPVPPADRLRLRGLDPARRYRVTAWPAGDEPLAAANTGVHGGDELMAVGLSLGAERHAASGWGDFRAWLFALEAV
jgi:alpha-galactosidase